MSFNNIICNLDIINIIFKLCYSIDSKLALSHVCEDLYKLLHTKAYFALYQNNLRLKILNNKVGKINCINTDCDNICPCLGLTTFIYSDRENQFLDNENIYIVTYSINKKVINRYIPYCKRCMFEFVNFGDRQKPILFGDSIKYNVNLFGYGFI